MIVLVTGGCCDRIDLLCSHSDMMVVVIWYDICTFFLLIIITLYPRNRYKTIYEKYF